MDDILVGMSEQSGCHQKTKSGFIHDDIISQTYHRALFKASRAFSEKSIVYHNVTWSVRGILATWNKYWVTGAQWTQGGCWTGSFPPDYSHSTVFHPKKWKTWINNYSSSLVPTLTIVVFASWVFSNHSVNLKILNVPILKPENSIVITFLL